MLNVSPPAAIPPDSAQAATALIERARSLSIRTVLVLVRGFDFPFRGVKLIAADLVRTLKEAGLKVTLGTFFYDPEFQKLFPHVDDVIDFHGDLRPLVGRSFDLVMTHGFETAGLTLLEAQVSFRYLVMCSYSSFTPGEVIYGMEDQADALLFESEHNLEAQAPGLVGCPAARVTLRNALASQWFVGEAPPAQALRRVAVITQHQCAEVAEAAALLRADGIEVDQIGKGGVAELVGPETIDRYDLVISIGASMQKALVRGVPAFCYDHFGGPGYLTSENLASAERYNFSGRCSFDRRDGATLHREIMEGYERARVQADAMRRVARERYRMAERLAAMLGAMTRREERRSFDDRRYDNVRRLYQLVANRDYSSPVFAFGYMANANGAKGLRVVRAETTPDEGIASASIAGVSPFIFLSEYELPFRIVVTAEFVGRVGVKEFVVKDQERSLRVKPLTTMYRPKADKTTAKAALSFPVSVDTRSFRILVTRQGDRAIEFGRVRFLR